MVINKKYMHAQEYNACAIGLLSKYVPYLWTPENMIETLVAQIVSTDFYTCTLKP